MNWPRLIEIIEMARRRTGREPDPRKPDQGYNWSCYCPVCCELRYLTSGSPSLPVKTGAT